MTRILDLQKLEAVVKAEAEAASTSSYVGCACSTNSASGCVPDTQFIAV